MPFPTMSRALSAKRLSEVVPKVTTESAVVGFPGERANRRLPLENVLNAAPPDSVVKRRALFPPEITVFAGVEVRVR